MEMAQRKKFDPSISSADSFWSCLSLVDEEDDEDDTLKGLETDDDSTYYTGAGEEDGIIEQDPAIVEHFREMQMKSFILDDILDYGFNKPTEFQQRALVACIKKKDVIAHAEAGSGKKVACVIAVLQNIRASKKSACQALILVPNKRVVDELEELIAGIGERRGIKVDTYFGGRSILEDKMHVGPHVVIGGIQIMSEAIRRGYFKTNSLAILILYDAEKLVYGENRRMLDSIYSRIKRRPQVISFSRTLPAETRKQLQNYMNRPLRIGMGKEDLGFGNVRQFHLITKSEEAKLEAICCLAAAAEEKGIQTVVFCNTRGQVGNLTKSVKKKLPELNVAGLHPGMNHEHQDEIAEEFASGSVDVLITTELVAQQHLDMNSVRLTINYELPNMPLSYNLRVGRKNRVSELSVAINLVESALDLMKIQEYFNVKIGPMPRKVMNIL